MITTLVRFRWGASKEVFLQMDPKVVPRVGAVVKMASAPSTKDRIEMWEGRVVGVEWNYDGIPSATVILVGAE